MKVLLLVLETSLGTGVELSSGSRTTLLLETSLTSLVTTLRTRVELQVLGMLISETSLKKTTLLEGTLALLSLVTTSSSTLMTTLRARVELPVLGMVELLVLGM